MCMFLNGTLSAFTGDTSYFSEVATRPTPSVIDIKKVEIRSFITSTKEVVTHRDTSDSHSRGHRSRRNVGRKPRNHIKFLRHSV
jgi:hypothetical protein